MEYAFILLFLYASYLSIEKYVHTGSLFAWRGKLKEAPSPPVVNGQYDRCKDTGIIGRSLYNRHDMVEVAGEPPDSPDECKPESVPAMGGSSGHSPETTDPFKQLESGDLPERYEITGYVERPDPHRARGVTFDDMDMLERIMTTDEPSPAEQSRARKTLNRLEGTNVERILQAGILGSNEKLKRYMKLYVDSNEEPALLLRKDRDTIIRDFDITDFIP